jgi:DTW domain-containing protein YfiP
MLCVTCRLHTTLCICALVPRLRTQTRVHLVVPAREARKPSNTGLLAARCIEGSTVQILYKRSGPMQAPDVRLDERPLVLFPSPQAVPITEYAGSPQPIALIVPDGSWSQARHRHRRGPLRHYTCVTLPPSGPSEYRLRDEPQVDGLATFEAIARALRILEGAAGAAIERTMLDVFRVMVERTLWFRGKLHDHEVTGGIPPAARADDPRGAATRAALSRLERSADLETVDPHLRAPQVHSNIVDDRARR